MNHVLVITDNVCGGVCNKDVMENSAKTDYYSSESVESKKVRATNIVIQPRII